MPQTGATTGKISDPISHLCRGLFISIHWGPVTSTSSALHCPISLSQLPPGLLRLCAPDSPHFPARVPSLFLQPSPLPGRHTRTQASAALTFSRRWWRRHTSPAATTDPASQFQTHRCLRRAPLALPLAPAPPTPTLIGPAPRPSPPPPDPLVGLRAHLPGKTLATRTKLPSQVRLPTPYHHRSVYFCQFVSH